MTLNFETFRPIPSKYFRTLLPKPLNKIFERGFLHIRNIREARAGRDVISDRMSFSSLIIVCRGISYFFIGLFWVIFLFYIETTQFADTLICCSFRDDCPYYRSIRLDMSKPS